MRPWWRDPWQLVLAGLMLVLVLVTVGVIVFGSAEVRHCEELGGHMTRDGCLKSSTFVQE